MCTLIFSECNSTVYLNTNNKVVSSILTIIYILMETDDQLKTISNIQETSLASEIN